ncbi:MAG TPA: hypothetical protein VLN59_11470, partial [Burkholderiales bacterium]|nr:hypothetical protein [Burkholderiales bacterium]
MNELSENRRVQVRFLLGPAGVGKTFQCLQEIRAELKRSPEGPPLLFLAPKQATFQIERQLLGDGGLPGYTRLQILSFERLADFIMESIGAAPAEIMSEEGRVMVLRALLAEKHSTLRTFRSTARLPGFAQQLSALLRELQQQRLSPSTLLEAAQDARTPAALRNKLHDVALLLGAYRGWLKTNGLLDSEELLGLAADALHERERPGQRSGGRTDSDPDASLTRFQPGMQLWLDGFAEMTPQELNLLAAFTPLCERATLAFCLENVPAEQNASWLSLWSVVAQTFQNCRNALAAAAQCHMRVEVIRRDPIRGRFRQAPVLAHVERHWAAPIPMAERASDEEQPQQSDNNSTSSLIEGNPGACDGRSVRVVTCANPEAEAVFAAREILRFVRERAARFRDCAVLVRSLDGYHATVRRVFTRYGVPLFLDRRESIAHHPLAELTRFALRMAAFGWRNEDWFGVLKTGLVHRDDEQVDRLENEALARGWDGAQWTRPLRGKQAGEDHFEALRRILTPPFEKLDRAVASLVNGSQLAMALRALWSDLEVETTLARWADEMKRIEPSLPQMQDTVLSQMELWLENIERAFASQALNVKDWLPILEAGLAGLTVGVIPPSLDQVLIGAIDRSRNPDLRLTFVLGMNETIFPAPPARAPILTEDERVLLAEWAAVRQRSLGASARQRIAHERFYGYIASTRSCERLVLTCAAANGRGATLNPSPFLAHLDRLVPGVFPARPEDREWFSAPDWRDAQHVCEVAAPLIDGAHPELAPLADIDTLTQVVHRAQQFASATFTREKAAGGALTLAPALVARLYPSPFTTSVSALEDF